MHHTCRYSSVGKCRYINPYAWSWTSAHDQKKDCVYLMNDNAVAIPKRLRET